MTRRKVEKDTLPKREKWGLQTDTRVARHSVTLEGPEPQKKYREFTCAVREFYPSVTLSRDEGSDELSVSTDGNCKLPTHLVQTALDTVREMKA